MVFSDWIKPGGVLRRLAKRLFQVVVTLFGLLILTFVIGRVMPIDPVSLLSDRMPTKVPINRFTNSWGWISRYMCSSLFTSIH